MEMDLAKKLEILLRRREIMREISEIKEIIREARSLIREYDSCSKAIHKALEQWEQKKTAYNTILLASVQVKDYFEGYSARQIYGRLTPVINEIDKAGSQTGNVLPGISDQIQKLEEYIEQQEKKIEALQTELEALEI